RLCEGALGHRGGRPAPKVLSTHTRRSCPTRRGTPAMAGGGRDVAGPLVLPPAFPSPRPTVIGRVFSQPRLNHVQRRHPRLSRRADRPVAKLRPPATGDP